MTQRTDERTDERTEERRIRSHWPDGDWSCGKTSRCGSRSATFKNLMIHMTNRQRADELSVVESKNKSTEGDMTRIIL